MAKLITLNLGGVPVYPNTVTDAIADVASRKRLSDIIAELQSKPAGDSYSIVKDSESDLVYRLMKNGTEVAGEINIAADTFLDSALNNIVSVVEEMEKQHKTDIAILKNQINTLNDKLVDVEYNMLEKDAVDATTLYSTDSSTGEVSLNSNETIKYELEQEESIIPESATEQRVLPISAKNILIS